MSETPPPSSSPSAPLASVVTERIEPLLIEDELRQSYLGYAMSVNVSRALPDVRDGLKPVQRRILYSMHRGNVRGKTIKCAKVVGDVMGNFHPHGDSSIYEALVRMAQDFSMRHPLIRGQGNFGTDDGDPPADMRYTECCLARIADEMVADIDAETVDFGPTFDDSDSEPRVLPSRIPNLLVNGASGIGVAMATNIPPHNLGEICDAVRHLLDNPAATVDDLMGFVLGPDFPTRAIICGRRGLVDAYRTGRGSITVRARYKLEEKKGTRRLVFTEFPFQIVRLHITEKIKDLINDGKLPGVTGVNDASDKDGLKLHVELRRDADEAVVVNTLFEFTALQSNFAANLVALHNGRPRLMNLVEMLAAYIEHRREVIRRRTAYRLRKARQRAHILEGLILAIGDIDAVIRIIRESPDVPAARIALMARQLRLSESATLAAALPEVFYTTAIVRPRSLTQVQADAILAMTLSRLVGLAFEELAGEYRGLAADINRYEAILADDALVDNILREDLAEVRERHADERRTELGPPVGSYDPADFVEEAQVVVTISHAGYIKRTKLAEYRSRGRGTRGLAGAELRDNDFLERMIVASTHDWLLVFTNHGKCHSLKVLDLPEQGRAARGRALANLLEFAETESVAAVLSVREFDERFVMTATAQGVVKKTALQAYARPKRGGLIAVGLEPDDVLIGVDITDGQSEIVLGTADGMSIRFAEDEVRAMGRSATGVTGVKLETGDRVVDMVVIRPAPPAADTTSAPDLPDLLTVCENGYGKRTPIEEYRAQGRGGKGVINIKSSERNGRVVALKDVRDRDGLVMITNRGVMNRIAVGDIRSIGRATQGVRLMSLDAGDRVVAVARVLNDDEELPAAESHPSV